MQQTFAVTAKGVGRRDYSTGTEFSVESTIRSYQEVYSHWETITVPAGSDLVTDIAIPGGYVAILYDFYASFPLLTLMHLDVDVVTDATIGHIIDKTKYGSIAVHLAKGFPFFETIRFTLHNFHDEDIDVDIGAVGIYTDEEHYYLRVA